MAVKEKQNGKKQKDKFSEFFFVILYRILSPSVGVRSGKIRQDFLAVLVSSTSGMLQVKRIKFDYKQKKLP